MHPGKEPHTTIIVDTFFDGIEVTYHPTEHLLTFVGWYENYEGIGPETVPLGTFLSTLGITLDDCHHVLAPAMKEES